MSLSLSNLPYEENALEPGVSARTVGIHYNKHHRGYALSSTGGMDAPCRRLRPR